MIIIVYSKEIFTMDLGSWALRQWRSISLLQLELAVIVHNLGFPPPETHRPWILLLVRDSSASAFSSGPAFSQWNSPPPYPLVCGLRGFFSTCFCSFSSLCCGNNWWSFSLPVVMSLARVPWGLCCCYFWKHWLWGPCSSEWFCFWWKPWPNLLTALWLSFSPTDSCSSFESYIFWDPISTFWGILASRCWYFAFCLEFTRWGVRVMRCDAYAS